MFFAATSIFAADNLIFKRMKKPPKNITNIV